MHRSPVLRGRPLPLRSVARRGRNAKCVGFSRGDPSIAIVSGTISAGKSGERVPATRPVRINPAHFNFQHPATHFTGLRLVSVPNLKGVGYTIEKQRVKGSINPQIRDRRQFEIRGPLQIGVRHQSEVGCATCRRPAAGATARGGGPAWRAGARACRGRARPSGRARPRGRPTSRPRSRACGTR